MLEQAKYGILLAFSSLPLLVGKGNITILWLTNRAENPLLFLSCIRCVRCYTETVAHSSVLRQVGLSAPVDLSQCGLDFFFSFTPLGHLLTFSLFSLQREWIQLENVLCSCNCRVRAGCSVGAISVCSPLWILYSVDRNDDKQSLSLDMTRQSETQFTGLYSMLLEIHPARRETLPRMEQCLNCSIFRHKSTVDLLLLFGF